MNRSTARPAHPLAAVCLFLVLILAAVTVRSTEDIESTRKALDAVVERLNALDQWLDDADRQRARWAVEIRDKDREVAEMARAVEDARAAVQDIEADLEALGAEQAELEARRTEQAERIGRHLAASYRMAGEDFVKLLLNQQSPETLARMTRYHRYFTKARLESLAAFRATLAELDANREALESSRAEAEHRRADLEERRRGLIRERESRKTLLANLNAEFESKTAERKRLEADRDRLQALFEELNRRSMELDGSEFVARKGSLPWPLAGRVANAFGQPRADGRLTWHGMRIDAEEGTAVRAVFRGRVVFANWLRGFGLLTIVDHGGGYMTLYGHADVLLKTVGDWVEGGEIIARAGRSGGQQTSGLYFEVRQKGVARDPIGWLQRR